MATEEEKKKWRERWKNRTPEQIKRSEEWRKARYLKYKDEENEGARKRITKYRKENGMERDKKWRKENHDKILEYRKKHYIKHRETDKEKNRIRAYAYNHLRKELIKKRGGCCEMCGSKENLQIHHIKYDNEEESLMVVCSPCHHSVHR